MIRGGKDESEIESFEVNEGIQTDDSGF